MNKPQDISVQEIGAAKLVLRSDLVFTPQVTDGQRHCMVEDPLTSKFYRLGAAEYAFITMLDGSVTVRQALRRLSTVMPTHSLTEDDAVSLCRWLVDMELARSGKGGRSNDAEQLARHAAKTRNGQLAAKWNPLTFRLPLSRADGFFSAVHRVTGWLHSPAAMSVWMLCVVVGAYQVFSDWERFQASSRGVFAPNNWLWLGLCWLALKIVHEAAHGAVCKRYGGVVRETGVFFVLLAPLAYVDVTSSWRFRSKWQRIHVAMAGMYIELWIAAIAAIFWVHTSHAWIENLCFNVIVMASATTVLFNANPLMRFDGYYVLSDALSLPNLQVNGQNYLRAWARRWLLGMASSLPDWGRRQTRWISIYGWAAMAWRLLVTFGLIVTATTMLRGAGVILACVGVTLWWGLPLWRFATWFCSSRCPLHRRLRFAAVTGGASLLLAIAANMPWPGSCSAPAVVEYSPHVVVRAASSGFVRDIHVESGESVEVGDILVEIENRELAREVEELAIQIEQSEFRSRQFEQRGEVAKSQNESKAREAIRQRFDEKRSELEQLVVRAPQSGIIISRPNGPERSLSAMVGSYMNEGEEILSVGVESSKELLLFVAQKDSGPFAQRVGGAVKIDIPGRPLWQGRLTRLNPRASRTPHPALSAHHGGPLDVREVAHHSDAATADDGYELLEPRFEGAIALGSEAASLRAGQRATVIYQPMNESVSQHLYHAASRWIQARITLAE